MGNRCSGTPTEVSAEVTTRINQLLHSDLERNAFASFLQSKQPAYFPVFDLVLHLERCIRHRNEQKGLTLRETLVAELHEDSQMWQAFERGCTDVKIESPVRPGSASQFSASDCQDLMDRCISVLSARCMGKYLSSTWHRKMAGKRRKFDSIRPRQPVPLPRRTMHAPSEEQREMVYLRSNWSGIWRRHPVMLLKGVLQIYSWTDTGTQVTDFEEMVEGSIPEHVLVMRSASVVSTGPIGDKITLRVTHNEEHDVFDFGFDTQEDCDRWFCSLRLSSQGRMVIDWRFLGLEPNPIGAGASGQVFRGDYLGRTVAAKELFVTLMDPATTYELEAELGALDLLQHENIVTFHGLSISSSLERVLLVTEFCHHSLDPKYHPLTLLPTNSFYSTSMTDQLYLSCLTQIARALAYMHDQCLVHRDIKPANIMLNQRLQVKVCDFGLAAACAEVLKTRGCGTAGYLAPEALDTQTKFTGPEIDVFAFAITVMTSTTDWRRCFLTNCVFLGVGNVRTTPTRLRRGFPRG
eukprot:TRINITY_DN11867_c0_g2_i1.p1 TRINITY_DN11867_c0_g2~~TRINITY_DN11867_c0_g2_i1.p1  ORF type:complete len:522 (-),score=120.82 TRINITY_DN11867_c0_g2_i1:1470-3035(-)